MPGEDKDIWFDEEDGEVNEESDVPAPDSIDKDILEKLTSGSVVPMSPTRLNRLMKLLGLDTELVADVEREIDPKGDKLIESAVQMAKEKSIVELNELFLTAVVARMMVSHCESCAIGLKKAVIKSVETIPPGRIMKIREKNNIKVAE